MPLKNGVSRDGRVYSSPLGDDDPGFGSLALLDRQYVHHYGAELRKTALGMTGVVLAQELAESHGRLVSQRGAALGRDSRRLASFATLRWLHARGEFEKLNYGWRRAERAEVPT